MIKVRLTTVRLQVMLGYGQVIFMVWVRLTLANS